MTIEKVRWLPNSARVLIVDDEPSQVNLLAALFRANGVCDIVETSDPRKALGLFLETNPDLAVIDLLMPHMDGFSVTRQIRSRSPGFVPILVITGDASREAKLKALSAGASDFISKPLDPVELVVRSGHLLEIRRLYLAAERQKEHLEELVRERTEELEAARDEVLERLALVAEYWNKDTARHTERVARLSELLALKCGLAPEEARLIGKAALLHDLGKLGLRQDLLLKNGPLAADELELVKAHTSIGARILAGSRSRLLQLAEVIALYHHERWDGTGYTGLRQTEIPLPARIVAVADAFDAMSHDRPYRKKLSMAHAVEELRRAAGRQLDPLLVEKFAELYAAGELDESA